MGTLLEFSAVRRDNAGYVSLPVGALPPGCKGPACPAFALCQGRCEVKRAERGTHLPGYPGGVTGAS
jgi:hypothetical protein